MYSLIVYVSRGQMDKDLNSTSLKRLPSWESCISEASSRSTEYIICMGAAMGMVHSRRGQEHHLAGVSTTVCQSHIIMGFPTSAAPWAISQCHGVCRS